jgi:hypothetical protein
MFSLLKGFGIINISNPTVQDTSSLERLFQDYPALRLVQRERANVTLADIANRPDFTLLDDMNAYRRQHGLGPFPTTVPGAGHNRGRYITPSGERLPFRDDPIGILGPLPVHLPVGSTPSTSLKVKTTLIDRLDKEVAEQLGLRMILNMCYDMAEKLRKAKSEQKQTAVNNNTVTVTETTSEQLSALNSQSVVNSVDDSLNQNINSDTRDTGSSHHNEARRPSGSRPWEYDFTPDPADPKGKGPAKIRYLDVDSADSKGKGKAKASDTDDSTFIIKGGKPLSEYERKRLFKGKGLDDDNDVIIIDGQEIPRDFFQPVRRPYWEDGYQGSPGQSTSGTRPTPPTTRNVLTSTSKSTSGHSTSSSNNDVSHINVSDSLKAVKPKGGGFMLRPSTLSTNSKLVGVVSNVPSSTSTQSSVIEGTSAVPRLHEQKVRGNVIFSKGVSAEDNSNYVTKVRE